MLDPYLDNPLVCLDFSDKMLLFGRKRNQDLNIHYVLGVFEALPFRENTACFVAAAYAIRDSLDKKKTLSEIHHTLRSKGKLLLIDIGKPNNTLIREFMKLYMQYIVPILGGLES
jgi:demethylmenaquinone methyltransferase/2-methoxy-6-polyprenyl-1,4-benzoquinol methylase